ncbi:PTS sugar transporter subunit IIB, partial [Bacillus sp. B-TM1]
MEGIVHIRVDDRLIHGQVATRWATGLRVNRIMIIDDKVAVNDDEKSILRMAAPAGVNTSILTFEKGLNNVKNGNYKGQRVLLIVKTPEILVQLMNSVLAI